MSSPNVNTFKTVAETAKLKEDPWGYAQYKFSEGLYTMDRGQKRYVIPPMEPLSSYIKHFPTASSFSIQTINTASHTERDLLLFDSHRRLIHVASNIEVKDEEIYIERLPPPPPGLFTRLFGCFSRPRVVVVRNNVRR